MYDRETWKLLTGKGRLAPSKYFDYLYYDIDTGLYFMKDGTIGFIIQIYPILGIDDGKLKSVKDIFSLEVLHENDAIQVINFSTDNIDGPVRRFLSKKTSDLPVMQKYCQRIRNFLYYSRDNGYRGIFPDTYVPKDFQVMVTFRTALTFPINNYSILGLANILQDVTGLKNNNDPITERQAEILRTLKIKREYQNLLKTAGTEWAEFPPRTARCFIIIFLV